MKSYPHPGALLTIAALLYSPVAFSQDDTAAAGTEAEKPAKEETQARKGQEVEVNEDNYRQFMELKDTGQQRGVFPETAYKSQTGTQKLDGLPEESQKHLRNQLREIIVQGDQWKPGDEDGEYPYTPSAMAGNNPTLQKQEAEAWSELVDGYHQREAEIYANSARSQAAAAAGSQGGGSGDAEGRNGDASMQGTAGQQDSQENSDRQKSAAGSYSPNAANDPNVQNTAGVSQNAMEFLQGNTATSNSAEQSPTQGNSNNKEQIKQESAQNALEFLQENSTGSPANVESPGEAKHNNKEQAKQESAQNALQYLTGDQQQDVTRPKKQFQADQTSTDSSPLPELPSLREPLVETTTDEISEPELAPDAAMDDTISIEDLLNVQGIGRSNAAELTEPVVEDPRQTLEKED